MAFTFRARPTAVLVSAVLLAACGSTGAARSNATPTRAPSASPTPGPLPAALTADDIVDSGPFSQQSDGLLGGLENTDARVFTNVDGTVIVEVDLVADTGATGAAADYPPYQSAAATQVSTKASTSSPGFGQQAAEYAGTNAAGKNAVSISFIEGSYIAVVTVVGNGTATSDVVRTIAESIAQAQDNKINSIGS